MLVIKKEHNEYKLDNKNITYYKTFSDDFVESRNQQYSLKSSYEWIHNDFFHNIAESIIYVIALIVSFFYLRCEMHMRIKDMRNIKQTDDSLSKGCLIYGNHTQPAGDAFIPAHIMFPRRIYVVVSPANLGIPVLGRLLPMLGALPIPSSIEGMKKFTRAINTRLEQKKCVVVYPEAHVWPYYTGIRPYSETSFRYAVDNNVPVMAMTTTYQKIKKRRKPRMTVYVDGPFYADKTLSARDQRKQLRDIVYETMVSRSHASNYEYIQYKQERV